MALSQTHRNRTTIEKREAQFSSHGIPITFYGILHKTSSPHTPHSNGEAERAVQTVKRLWCKATDKHLALMDYRTTPFEAVGLSPAQLLLGRRPRNKLPAARSLLSPTAHDPQKVQQSLDKTEVMQKYYYDRRRVGKNRAALKSGEEVRMQPHPGYSKWSPAVVVKPHSAPRSYIVSCGDKYYRRNVQHRRSSTSSANQTRQWISSEPWAIPTDEPEKKSSPCPETSDHLQHELKGPVRSNLPHPTGFYITR
uniref:Integrase catalytic domain-containing protein n=1 Tax=Monopterus albus TaxID=43700 RepID=A0A3Q3JLE6_MONAL